MKQDETGKHQIEWRSCNCRGLGKISGDKVENIGSRRSQRGKGLGAKVGVTVQASHVACRPHNLAKHPHHFARTATGIQTPPSGTNAHFAERLFCRLGPMSSLHAQTLIFSRVAGKNIAVVSRLNCG